MTLSLLECGVAHVSLCRYTLEMNSFEDPILSPEGEGRKSHRYESADVPIKQLEEYLSNTAFENEEEISQFLSETYYMKRRESIGEIDIAMTLEVNIEDLKNTEGEDKVDRNGGSHPVSECEAEPALRKTIMTTDGVKFDLRIFKVIRRDQFRYEYILNQL
jgi:hypothetical protein